ncbi:MAG: amidohydrolase family protein [Clostridia bacterium]|nr:amidohydrolase family protein [Clostridia bacterium]
MNEAGDLAKVWAIAPEREGMESFLAYVKKVNPHAMISVGHSEATPLQIKALKKYGIGLQTHCMNATGRPPCPLGTRSCGPDEACLMDKDMYAELICDSLGIHVPPDMLQLVLSVKGIEKIVLISDSYVGEPSPEEMRHVTDLSFDANGNLSGSKLTLDVACRNLVKHTGCSIPMAFLAASTNPAKVIGLYDEIGSLAAGKRADLVFIDQNFTVKKIMLEGQLQKGIELC